MVLSSAIVDLIAICDLRSAGSYGNQPYLLRSSAIVIAGSQTIAEVCFHMIADDRRLYCDLRSAIRDHMETSLMIADDRRPYCDLRSAIIWKPALRWN